MLTKEVKCKLVNSQGFSTFKFEEETQGSIDMDISVPKRESYFKELISNKLTTITYLADEPYRICDNLPKIEWKIEDSNQKIKEYNCQKATANYKGTQLVCWFTKDIAIADGPLMLQGLPGLIIKVTINNIVTYTAEKIIKDNKVTVLAPFKEGKKIEKADFEKLKAKFAEEKLLKQKEAGALHLEVK